MARMRLRTGLIDDGSHHNGQESETHDDHAMAYDEEISEFDLEEHGLVFNFLQKCRHKTRDHGASHAMDETQGQAEPSTHTTPNENNISPEVPQATGTQITEAVTAELDYATLPDTNTNPAHANPAGQTVRNLREDSFQPEASNGRIPSIPRNY